ncbi:MAG: DUF4250 domain-containing protein [Clostridium sp.]|nr:DUF4250 domain-containing protein [Clostridium sp.]MCM1170908.1 DUF4250 domain-containing protein [Clostridium sp.]MCM1207342.1 DUF4250 domain-containing protein [Ruminococcus sp.]
MAIDVLPKDPMMLLSFVNTRMRDENINLAELCEQFGTDREAVEGVLEKIEYHYDDALRKFI